MRGMTRLGRRAVAGAGVLTVTGAMAAQAITLNTWTLDGVQYVNEDCSRNEYLVDATVTGTTDDGGGYDQVRFEVWDDGVLKDSRVREVAVGTTMDLHVYLSFVGVYGTGAPGVGIVINDIDAAGVDHWVDWEDPYIPEDVDGVCSFNVERIGGPSRIETAALLSQQKFVSADTVLIATSRTFPDALAAAPWAAQLGAPLLLSSPGGLSAATVAELQRLNPSAVLVIGGSGALGQGVIDDIYDTLPLALVERIGGADRYATAGIIAEHVIQDSSKEVYVASGQDFPDALVLSALAARNQAPIVLLRQGTIPEASALALQAIEYDHLYAAGGTSVLSDGVLTVAAEGAPVTRYAGADRYATAQEVLAEFPAEGKVMVATGADFPDSLTAVPVAARTGAGVALTRPSSVPGAIMGEIVRLTAGESFPLITIVGGENAVNASVETQLLGLFPKPQPAETGTGSTGSAQSNLPTQ